MNRLVPSHSLANGCWSSPRHGDTSLKSRGIAHSIHVTRASAAGSELLRESRFDTHIPRQDEEKEIGEQREQKKKIKQEPLEGISKRVYFQSPRKVKTVYSKIKCQTEEIELACEEDYSLRNSDFALKRREKKLTLKLHHKSRPLTPRRIRILERLKRENNMSSISSS